MRASTNSHSSGGISVRGVAFAVAHRQPRSPADRSRRPGRSGGARSPSPGPRVPIWNSWRMRPVIGSPFSQRRRKIGAEPAIGARRAGIPARPDQRVAAPEHEAEPGIARLVFGSLVRAGSSAGDFVEQCEDALARRDWSRHRPVCRCRAAVRSGAA